MKNEQMPAWKAASIVLGTVLFLTVFMYVRHHPEAVSDTVASVARGVTAE